MAVGWMLVIQRLVSVIFFKMFRLIFVAIQRIYWELNGTGRQMREAADPRCYERSVQVLDVLMELHFCDQQAHTMQDFLCVHNRFENPQFIIDNEHVTLFAINDCTAVFGVARKKSK